MATNNKHKPILITGVERSGSSLIAQIMSICGVFLGECNQMYENRRIHSMCLSFIELSKEETIDPIFRIPSIIDVKWKEKVQEILLRQRHNGDVWCVKNHLLTQLYPLWHQAYPDAKWVIVRRRSADIINSCTKTNYMDQFRTQDSRDLIGVGTEEEAWRWLIRKYEETWTEMILNGLNCKVIWPERMVTGDYGQIYELLEWLGLRWTPKIPSRIDPLLNKARRN